MGCGETLVCGVIYNMNKIMFFMCSFLFFSSQAFAGDPCPISYEVFEFVKDEAQKTEILKTLESQKKWLGVSYENFQEKVRVKHVREGSPVAKAGLQVDDVIVAVDGQLIHSVKEANAVFDAAMPTAESFVLQVKRNSSALQPQLLLLKVVPGYVDPVYMSFFHLSEHRECTSVMPTNLSEDQKQILSSDFGMSDLPTFCKVAHQKISLPKSQNKDGTIVFFRDKETVFLSLLGWNTLCLPAKDLDGEKLTIDNVKTVFTKLTKELEKERHDNP